MTLLVAKTETVLLGMTDRLTAIGKCYGIEMDFEKTKVMRISRQLFPTQIMILFLPLHRAFLRFIHHYTPTNAPNLFTI
jgi:hypothetical protein